MEVLVRVVESGSDSGTARRLRVGQPAVSKTVAQLKESLGVSLLLRSSRGLTRPRQARTFTSAPSARSRGRTRRSWRRATGPPVCSELGD